MKYNENNYSYNTLAMFYAVEDTVVAEVLYRLKLYDVSKMSVDQLKEHLPNTLYAKKTRWTLKYVSKNNDNLSVYYVDLFKDKLLRISNHWSYVSFSKPHSTKMWIRGCWWELHGKRASRAYHLPVFRGFYGGQVEFSKLQPVHN